MIAIIKYNAGNTTSVVNTLQRLGYETMITDDRKELEQAEKIIFPGVGEESLAMKYLQEKGIDKTIIHLQQPVLGICLGLQLMCLHSEEGNTKGLGIFDTNVRRFPQLDIVPHVGWNDFQQVSGRLFDKIKQTDNCYFVHSYYAECCSETIATTDYILPFSSALQKDNFYAVQFHPEKSQEIGLQILQNFLSL